MAEFENQVQSQAQRRDHRGLQSDARIAEFGAREKMKANEKAQEETEENENKKKDTNVFVLPTRRRIRKIMLNRAPFL